MSEYRLGLVRYHNFGPFKEASVDFSRPGLTVVEGEFVGFPGCKSNGSGKSFLFDGPAWALYDRCVRERYGKDDVVRLLFEEGDGQLVCRRDAKDRLVRPQGGCWVEVNLTGGASEVKVTRYRGHQRHGSKVRLEVDGHDVTRGRDAMTNKAIEELIGMDYRTFVNAVAFGAREDVRSFFTATDSTRKEILEKLLGLEVFAKALECARKRLSDATSELTALEDRTASLDESIVRHEALVASLVGDAYVEDLRWRWQLARIETWAAEKGQEHANADHVEVRRHRDDLDKEYREKAAAREQEFQAYRRDCTEADNELRSAEGALTKARTELRHAAKAVERWEEMAGRRCPTCEQVLDAQKGMRLKYQANKGVSQAEVSVRQCERVVEVKKSGIKSLQDSPPVPVDVGLLPDFQELDRDYHTRVRECAGVVRVREAEERAAKQAFERAERQNRQSADELKALQDERAEVFGKTEEAKRKVDQLEFWVHGFGNAGLKSFLLEAEVPTINRSATRFAQQLLGAGAVVRLSATKELKSGAMREELTVEGSIPGCAQAYAGASKGQKKRLDLALLLAFREVVASRADKAFRQLLADELFDGLDEAGEESVVEILREIASECPVILVTHSPGLKSVGDRLITVRHENGVASVEERA